MDNSPQAIWLALNCTKPLISIDKREDFKLNLNYQELLRIFKESDQTKIISLKKLTESDINELTSLNFSLDYLLKNFRQRVGQVTHDTREFQNRAVSHGGYVYALCPITGQILQSNHSIPVSLSVVFHRFVGAKVFYLVTANIGGGCPKDTLYFPEDQLAIRYENHRYGFNKIHGIIFKAMLVNFHQEFFQYFSRNSKKITALIGHENFAHHIWNELSALYRLKQKRIIKKLDKLFVFRQTLGKITDIFPELGDSKVQTIDNTLGLDEETLAICENLRPIPLGIISEMLKNNYSFINLADTFIPNGLNRRLYRVGKQQVNSQILQLINTAKKQCFPLLWISIRTQDRTWIQQTEGLTNMINALSAKFPKLGIVFDGFSRPADYQCLTSNQLLLINQEKAVVREIIAKINPNIPTFNMIGESIFSAHLWAHAVDLYLCHFGTLQHKIAWFASKPGIVHSNSRISANKSSQFRCYGVKEFGIPPKFINPGQIKDISVVMSATDLRNTVDNYDIDWQIIYDELIQMIDALEKLRNWRGKLIVFFAFVRQYIRTKTSRMPIFRRFFQANS